MPNAKRIQQLDLNLLKVFQTLYHEQNMTSTAEVLHLTPSAVSHAMKRLRETLGDPLFKRSQNKMLPTPACQRMAPLIVDNLTRLQQILQQWGDFEPSTSEHNFKIGMHDAYEPAILPQLTRLFSELAPNVSFTSVKVSRNNLARDLATGHVDVALDVSFPAPAAVKRVQLTSSEFVVLIRPEHPILNDFNPDTYMSATHLTVSNRPAGMTAEDSLFQQKGLVRKVKIRCQNYFAAKQIALNSDELLTLPIALATLLIDKDIVVRPLPIKISKVGTTMYWHEQTEHDAALAWLRSLLRERISFMHT